MERDFEKDLINKLLEVRELLKQNAEISTLSVYFNEDGCCFYFSNISETTGERIVDNYVV